MRPYIASLICLTGLSAVSGLAQAGPHSLERRIPPPSGYARIAVGGGSMAAWLRGLPLRPGCPPVYRYDGRPARTQNVHCAVLDMDIGTANLQQCADAVIRLRAEYLRAVGCEDEIQFNFTSGDSAYWRDWKKGLRPEVRGDRVGWRRTAGPDSSYENFRRYLDTVFTYAGTMSLSRELLPVADPSKPEIGDVFIRGGSPGHAMLVIDVAENPEGKRIFLLAQSYMPAQDIHVLKSDEDITPWFRAGSSGALKTPGSACMSLTIDGRGRISSSLGWIFSHQDLRRFRPASCETLQDPINR